MIVTGFLGYHTIAQNDYNNKIITTTTFNDKRYYSTSRNNEEETSFPRINKFLLAKNLHPVFIYHNLNEDSVRRNIAKETKGLSGIYMILNKETLSYYIGSASTDRINSRFSKHLIYLNGSKIVKNSVNKYGLHNFAFIVLELFPEIVNQENNKKLLDLEDFYLKSLLPNYNILTESGSSFGYKHNETIRLNMKTNYSEERRLAIGILNKGKSLSPSNIGAMKNLF